LELISDGVEEDGTIFLVIFLVIIFLFLVRTRGATIAEVYHFLHWWRSLAEEHIRGNGKEVEWLPIASYRF